MARGGGCQDERCRNCASEVGTDDGTAKKKKKKKERNKASQVLLSEKEEREQLKMTLGRFW